MVWTLLAVVVMLFCSLLALAVAVLCRGIVKPNAERHLAKAGVASCKLRGIAHPQRSAGRSVSGVNLRSRIMGRRLARRVGQSP